MGLKINIGDDIAIINTSFTSIYAFYFIMHIKELHKKGIRRTES